MSEYSVYPDGGFWEGAGASPTVEMTTAEAVVWTLRDLRDQWVTTTDILTSVPNTDRAYLNRFLAPLYHAGVLDRELMEGTGRYRYRWLGSGPGGVR